MKHLEDKDIRDALLRKESRRQETVVPDDFLDRVMDEISQSLADTEFTPQRTAMGKVKPMAIVLSVAASIALLVVFAWPRIKTMVNEKQDQQQLTATTNHPTKEKNKDSNTGTTIEVSQPKETTMPDTKLSNVATHPAPTREATTPQGRKSQQAIPSSGIDSLQYYIDKIEQELAVVDESLYIDRMNKVIRADERLQRMVSSYILHTLDEDGRPQTAENMSNVKKQENEDK